MTQTQTPILVMRDNIMFADKNVDIFAECVEFRTPQGCMIE